MTYVGVYLAVGAVWASFKWYRFVHRKPEPEPVQASIMLVIRCQ